MLLVLTLTQIPDMPNSKNQSNLSESISSPLHSSLEMPLFFQSLSNGYCPDSSSTPFSHRGQCAAVLTLERSPTPLYCPRQETQVYMQQSAHHRQQRLCWIELLGIGVQSRLLYLSVRENKASS